MRTVTESTIYVQPGQVFASTDEACYVTVLGSCVAVCLWDSALQIGGINHYLLPQHRTNSNNSNRFGTSAIPALIERLTSFDSRPFNLQAKIFGGARINSTTSDNIYHIGLQNIQIARELLSRERIEIIAEDVGGDKGRKILFCPKTGEVWVRQLERA